MKEWKKLKAIDYCVDVRDNTHLEHQLTLLTESRDRLLPKLMSGEIELNI